MTASVPDTRPTALTWANLVTVSRMVLGLAMVIVLVTGDVAADGWRPLAVLATVNLVLDGLDGWLARRLDQATALGARLDVETDSAIMVVMSVALLVAGGYGPWVLAFGAWRYAYLLAARLVPALRGPLRARPSRRVIAGIAMVAVIVALVAAGVDATAVGTVVAVIALALVSYSFGRDLVEQLGTSDRGSSAVGH